MRTMQNEKLSFSFCIVKREYLGEATDGVLAVLRTKAKQLNSSMA